MKHNLIIFVACVAFNIVLDLTLRWGLWKRMIPSCLFALTLAAIFRWA